MALAPHRDRPLQLGHAGALIGAAVDLDQAFLADPHAAEDAARLSAPGQAQLPDTGGGKCGGQGLAAPTAERRAFEIDGDGRFLRNQRPSLSPELRHLIPACGASLTGPRAAESNGQRKRKAG